MPFNLTLRPKFTAKLLGLNETWPLKSTSTLPGKPVPPVWRKL